jgi:hypothetical protein
MTANQIQGLMEAYSQVYNSEESLEQEIFESIAYTLISQGYSAIDVLEYFANVEEEVIVEDIVAISEGTLLIESVVSEEYIQEQLEILSEALPLVAAGAKLAGKVLLGKAARGAIAKGAGALGRGLSTAVKRAAGPGVRKAVGGAVGGARKAVGGAVGRLKDAARGVLSKLPGGSKGGLARGLKTAGKWALGGAAFEAGSRGVKSLMGDKGSKPKSTSTAKPSQTSAPKPSQTSAPKPSQTSAPKLRSVPKPKPVAKQTGDKAKDELTWAKANPRLAQAEKIRKEGGSRAEVNKVLYDKGTSAAEKTPTVVKAGVDIFDLIKGYLLDEGYVETEENAIAMMANISEEWRQSIVDEIISEGRRTSLSALARESQKRKEDKERGREETQDEKDKRLMMGRYSPSQYKYEKDEHGNWKNMGRKDGEED